jgi:N-acetyl-anhydromuramyl-L-alanine amidase AmpD/prophage tail gpP-like protein
MSALELGRTHLDNIRALITTKWSRGYVQRVVKTIESFTIDSSIDNDSDTWELAIGDPHGDLLAVMERNNEVRVELVTSTPGSAGHIFTGIADDIAFDETGVLTITGRDYSSLALDSTCLPVVFKRVKAKYVVANQARKLGFTNISLSEVGEWKKTIKTDGSETFWEFWYRLYRNEKMWLWCGPNGALIGNRLNYTQAPSYFFGTPESGAPASRKRKYIPVERVSIRKSTQARIGTVYVYWHNGQNHSVVPVVDTTIEPWIKRPNKIITDKVSHSLVKAREKGLEEIFEGNVGSLEITLTVSAPGYIVRTNRMAMIRLPEIGYSGEFFVVGWRMRADTSGYYQEIRLREKNYALSRRVPHEPVIAPPHSLPKTGLPGSTWPTVTDQTILAQLIPGDNPHQDWADYFYQAAKDYANGWDQDVFLAAILSLAWWESKIRNIREPTGHADNVEWFPYNPQKLVASKEISWPTLLSRLGWGSPEMIPAPRLKSVWEEIFVNEKDQVEAADIAHKELGVGPMRLTLRSRKHQADDMAAVVGANITGSTMAPSIDTYLKAKGSPMAGYGAAFVEAGKRNNVDPRLAVAIAGAETAWATNPNAAPASTTGHNAWGLLDAGSKPYMYSSWPVGISACLDNLGGSTYVGGGNISIAAIAQHWAPVHASNDPTDLNSNWPINVTKFYEELGGNPNNVTLTGASQGDTSSGDTTTAAGHDQYTAGRWNPENNIRVGAMAFREALDAINASPGDGKQIDSMVNAFGYYDGSNVGEVTTHMMAYRKILTVNPNFMGLATETIPAVRANATAQVDHHSEGSTAKVIMPEGWPTEAQCVKAFSGLWVGPQGLTDSRDLSQSASGSTNVLGPVKFLQAKFYRPDSMVVVKFIVVHTTESAQVDGGAENNANYFAYQIPDYGSAHYVVDNNSIVQCVKLTDGAYGVIGTDAVNGVSLNNECIHIEHVGCTNAVSGVADSPTDWTNGYTQYMLVNSTALAAKLARQFGIPTQHLTVAQIQAGQSGFVGHKDLNDAFNDGEGHTDPGPNWPWSQYMNMVRAA